MEEPIEIDAPTEELLREEINKMMNLGYIPVGESRDVEIISCGEGMCETVHWVAQRMIRDVDHD